MITKSKKPKTLKFRDLLWLFILTHHAPAPSRRQMVKLFNEFLTENKVGSDYTLPISGFGTVNGILKTLRELELVQPEGAMEVTETVRYLWEHVGTTWEKFPLEVQYSGAIIHWKTAIFR